MPRSSRWVFSLHIFPPNPCVRFSSYKGKEETRSATQQFKHIGLIDCMYVCVDVCVYIHAVTQISLQIRVVI